MKKYSNCYHIGPFEQLTRKVYSSENGLPSDDVKCVCFDKNGTLYVGTDKGLSIIKDGTIKSVDTGDERNVNMLYCAPDGRIFAGCGKTLSIVDGFKTCVQESFESDVVDMKYDLDSTKWVLTKTHLYRRKKGSDGYDFKIGVPGEATSFAALRDNKVYIGTAGSGFEILMGKRWHWSELTVDVTGLLSNNISCVDIDKTGYIWIGTDKGVCVYDDKRYWLDCNNTKGLPRASITAMAADKNGDRYFATTTGLIIQHNGRLSYYGFKRWLPDPYATGVAVSDDCKTICVSTKKGISVFTKQIMTLEEKAQYYRDMAEKYNVRKDGFCVERVLDHTGVVDENEGYVAVTDNDGLWTGYYVVGLCYEYAVTKDEETRRKARRSLDAMLKLVSITGDKGFVARALRYKDERGFQQNSSPEEWHLTDDGEIEWLGETSSDEVTGHFFTYSIYYQLCADEEEKKMLAGVIRKMTDHIIENNFRLVDLDGKPTTWANWNPQDLNGNHKWIYEKGTNTLEILGYLKAAKKMTGDEKYDKVFDYLMSEHHYGMNIMQYRIPDGHLLHIDDHLDFISIITLLTNTDDPAVRSLAMMGLRHHWNDERIEHNAQFNVTYGALTGDNCDVDVIANELIDMPLDLISWEVYNSHRTDLSWDHRPEEHGMAPQLYEPLEPHERRYCNSDGNRFVCDCGCEELFDQQEGERAANMLMYPSVSCDRGHRLDIGHHFLLPYWMGRYYGIIK